MSKRKKKKLLLVIFIIVIIVMIIININKKDKAGYIENVVYSQSIINKSYDKVNNTKTIEIKAEVDELNSIIITNDIIEKVKNNSSEYNRTLKEIIEDNQTSNRDKYNINKAIELNYVNEDTKICDYYWKVTGFKSLNKLIEFCEEEFNLMET